jgi:hypothetical protein
MAKARVGAGLMVGCFFLWGGAAPAWAAPTVAEMLSFRPKQDGVNYSTPTAQEQEACTVKLLPGAKRGSSGWLLSDASGRPLRRFFDSNGDKQIDVWSYYRDGAEVYREIDTNFNFKADQYRWLHAGGMKWGVDANEDGKIDSWKAISIEELSQEVLEAVVKRDYHRLQALMLTDAELKALDLPAAEATRLRELQKQAPSKFQSTVSKLTGLGPQTRWLHLETQPPQCICGDANGGKPDLIKYARATVLCETGGTHAWLQTGEVIQVGLAWRIVDAPVPGEAGGVELPEGARSLAGADPAVQKLLDELRELDAKAPKGQTPGPNPDVAAYNLARAGVIERLLPLVKGEDGEQWVRQLADCYSAAAQSSPAGDKAAYQRLVKLAERTDQKAPNSALAAFVTYREMSADYAAKLATPNADFAKIQEQWLERLAKYVQTYPKAEDTPDVLLQAAMVSEFVAKETEAKKWYEQLAQHFAGHPLAAKAQGSLRRLELEGKPLELSGPVLGGGSFDLARLKGKVVVVYYWASWNQQSAGDFVKLKALVTAHASQGLELVCVNLDNTAEEATRFLQQAPAVGVHLHQAGGLDSPLATHYGVMVLPNLFLVGKDGKVLSRIVQMNTLEDELKKALQ